MSNLVEHAKRELALVNEDPEVVKVLVEIVEKFASMRHSGGSAAVALSQLTRLLQFENLMLLTDDTNEWLFHDKSMWPPNGIWQNIRNSKAFSYDAGKTYWMLDDTPGLFYTSEHRVGVMK